MNFLERYTTFQVIQWCIRNNKLYVSEGIEKNLEEACISNVHLIDLSAMYVTYPATMKT